MPDVKPAVKKALTATIVRQGLQIILPAKMELKDAIEVLNLQLINDEKEVVIKEDVDAFIWDGALAFYKAMKEIYGFAEEQAIKTLFGEVKPQMISIEVGPKKTVLLPWGRFALPGVFGHVTTSHTFKNGQVILQVHAQTKKKFEPQIRALMERTREIVAAESIYKGKAFKIKFNDENGQRMAIPVPSFLDLSSVKENEIVFSKDVTTAVTTSLFTPIERSEDCRRFGVPLKRGILLTGPYGTGKTLAAYVAAVKAERHGWTYIYCESTDELSDAVKLAHHYQPSLVFCEDIDRVVQGERTLDMDAILNIIDGIESKNTELMVVLTTNHEENINRALLRPGRLDAIINVLPPDAAAVERLIRLYGRGLVPRDEDLTAVSKQLEGQIPAVIRECVERSKLSAIKLTAEGEELVITSDALTDAATSMQHQLDLLKDRKVDNRSNFERFGAELHQLLERMDKKIQENL